MNTSVTKLAGISLIMLAMTACAPLHPGGELVETGVLKSETKDTDRLRIKEVWAHADADGTHIHGKLQRGGYEFESTGHLEVSLLDRNGETIYQGTMKPSQWNATAGARRGYLHDETFHVVVKVPVPEQGKVTVVYHPGPEHDMKKP